MNKIKNHLFYIFIVGIFSTSTLITEEVEASYTPKGDEIAAWGFGFSGGGHHRGGGVYIGGHRGYYGHRGHYGRGYYRRPYYGPRYYNYGYYRNYYPRTCYNRGCSYYDPYYYYYTQPTNVEFYWGR